ncbi:hypothetical protein PGIGA_G00240390 [Pangasianodon gigas]|uniref:Uncharacterized protein n=1 Tax=Pangasianodon gigas TaxID=30993 RepID=A0ACC5WNV4_PANGG|nr:hypothetical protein [Pangasianodon gigas]
MSVEEPEQNCVSSGDRGGLFIPSDTEPDWAEEEEHGGRLGIQQKRLRGALDALFRAVRSETESVRPEHISTLVEIIVRNFRKKETAVSWVQPAQDGELDGELDCPGCNRFILEPVTVACGHSYCRSCLQQAFLSKCKKCREEIGAKHLLRANVLLCGLLEKWFPEEIQKTKRIAEVKELLRSKHFTQALSLATQLLESVKRWTLIGQPCLFSLQILCDLLVPTCESVQTLEESSEPSGLIRAQSLRAQVVGGARGEGLKRVSSAPQLGEKGALLKRKLSGLEAGPEVVENSDSKHKKQGVSAAASVCSDEDKPHHRVPRDLLDPSDFECSLCMRLFYEPVTTPCGHSFCKNCLQRSLDHSPQCPLCKESLRLYLASRRFSITRVLDDIIKRYLSEEHAARQKIHNDETKELSDLENNVPIFVCTMAYPTVPCPLHVFEPRYRLMIRRCIETGTRQFGMCISDAHKGSCVISWFRRTLEESSEPSGLIRAQSLRAQVVGGARGEGLKRVSSAPQLGEKGALLKRKLSGLEAGPEVVENSDSKHKKQGVSAAASVCSDEDKPHHRVPRDLLDPSDFECSLCMRLFYEPVTTPCGHSFCKNCLQRSLDHSPQCPLCKESLRLYLASRRFSITRVLDDIIKRYLSEEHAARQKIHNDETKELSDLENNVPIFVCTMAYPTVPCPLHVFEPRYRLMIRRCIETGTRQFGMCISDAHKGCVEGKEELQLQDLYDQVYNQASVWFHALENRFRNQILQHFGPMPEKENDIQSSPNGPACCWWLLAVLPVDPRYQLSVLSMTTLRERLVKIQHILAYLQNTHPE